MGLFDSVLASKKWLPAPLRKQIERLVTSQLGRRLAHGTFWSLVGVLASRGLNMAAMIFLARILGKNEFGEIGIIQVTLGMAQNLAGFGLGWAATKYVAEFRKCDPAKAGRIISFTRITAVGTGGVMAALFFVAAPWLAQHSLSAPHLALPLQISSLILFVGTLCGTQNGILAGFEAFRAIARINLLSGIISLPLIVGGGYLMGVEGAVWGMVVANAVSWVMNYWNLRVVTSWEGIQWSWSGWWKERKLLWDFSLPTILGGTAFNSAIWVCSALLVNRQGGYGEMGYYNAANQWFSALLFLPGVLGQAAIPVLSEQMGQKDYKRSRKILMYSVKLNAAVIFPVVIIGSLLSPWIMGLYGKDFNSAWATLVVTFISAAISALQLPAAQVITSSGHIWKAASMNLCWAVAFVAFASAMISLGSLGLAVSRCFAYLIYAIWSFWFASYLLNVKGGHKNIHYG